MSNLNPELKKLDGLKGQVVPNTNVILSRSTLRDGQGPKDAVAQITKVSVPETPVGDHYFKLTLPDKPSDFRGAIEVDDSQPGEPSLKILAEGIFGEEPDVLGTLVSVGLTESGIGRALVESRFSNLSPDFLRQAGGKMIEGSSDEPVLEFFSAPAEQIHDHPMAA
jgi:hypothetical protein